MGTPGTCASSSWKKFFHFDRDGDRFLWEILDVVKRLINVTNVNR